MAENEGWEGHRSGMRFERARRYIDDQALNEIVSLLQQRSALAAHVLFAAVGIPVGQDGVLHSGFDRRGC
jgi:hypothetical protein